MGEAYSSSPVVMQLGKPSHIVYRVRVVSSVLKQYVPCERCMEWRRTRGYAHFLANLCPCRLSPSREGHSLLQESQATLSIPRSRCIGLTGKNVTIAGRANEEVNMARGIANERR